MWTFEYIRGKKRPVLKVEIFVPDSSFNNLNKFETFVSHAFMRELESFDIFARKFVENGGLGSALKNGPVINENVGRIPETNQQALYGERGALVAVQFGVFLAYDFATLCKTGHCARVAVTERAYDVYHQQLKEISKLRKELAHAH